MSRQGDVISTVFYFCKEHNINRKDAIDFLFDVLQDAGHIESDDDGNILPDDLAWLTSLAQNLYNIPA